MAYVNFFKIKKGTISDSLLGGSELRINLKAS